MFWKCKWHYVSVCQCSCLFLYPTVSYVENTTIVTLLPFHLWLHCDCAQMMEDEHKTNIQSNDTKVSRVAFWFLFRLLFWFCFDFVLLLWYAWILSPLPKACSDNIWQNNFKYRGWGWYTSQSMKSNVIKWNCSHFWHHNFLSSSQLKTSFIFSILSVELVVSQYFHCYLESIEKSHHIISTWPYTLQYHDNKQGAHQEAWNLFLWPRIEQPITEKTSVDNVKLHVSDSIDPEFDLLPSDVKLLYKGKPLENNETSSLATLSHGKTIMSTYCLMATGASSRKSNNINLTLTQPCNKLL